MEYYSYKNCNIYLIGSDRRTYSIKLQYKCAICKGLHHLYIDPYYIDVSSRKMELDKLEYLDHDIVFTTDTDFTTSAHGDCVALTLYFRAGKSVLDTFNEAISFTYIVNRSLKLLELSV